MIRSSYKKEYWATSYVGFGGRKGLYIFDRRVEDVTDYQYIRMRDSYYVGIPDQYEEIDSWDQIRNHQVSRTRIAEDSIYVLDEYHESCKIDNTHMNYAQRSS